MTSLVSSSRRRPKLVIRPHPAQAKALMSRASVVAVIAGTGGGKTVLGNVWLLKKMLADPGKSWLVVEPNERMLTRNLATDTEGRMSLLGLLKKVDPAARFQKSEWAIFSRFGTVWLMSAEKPESMEGAHVAGAWLDEAGQMPYRAYETARRRVAFESGQVLITTTPYNRGWLYRRVYLAGPEQGVEVIRFSSLANPNYPKAEYERNKAAMDPSRFRMFHEGGFERPAGQIYSVWDESEMVVQDFEIPGDWPLLGGLDYGYNHPTAAVWLAEGPDGVFYVFREYKATESTIFEHWNQMVAKCATSVPVWYDDPAGAQYSAEMRRLGLPVRGANKEVQAGIDTVASLMAAGRLRVFASCVGWREEVEGYSWAGERDGTFSDAPNKVDDDLMDATRYALHSRLKSGGFGLQI